MRERLLTMEEILALRLNADWVGVQHRERPGQRLGGDLGARPGVLLRGGPGVARLELAGRDDVGTGADDGTVPAPGGLGAVHTGR